MFVCFGVMSKSSGGGGGRERSAELANGRLAMMAIIGMLRGCRPEFPKVASFKRSLRNKFEDALADLVELLAC